VDGQGLAPTGDSVFGSANVAFSNDQRRLAMEFTIPVSSVSIDFAGGSLLGTEIGQLGIYDAGGGLLETYLTAPRGAGEPETMTLTRPASDIARAIAYIAEGNGTFGRLDRLTFLPEPAGLGLLAAGAVLILRRR